MMSSVVAPGRVFTCTWSVLNSSFFCEVVNGSKIKHVTKATVKKKSVVSFNIQVASVMRFQRFSSDSTNFPNPKNNISKLSHVFFFFFFFYQGFLSRTLTTHRTAGEERGPSYSTLQLPPAHEHSNIYLQLCM